ncbi:MAG: type II secretion system protein [Candidatus Saccharibacteria bacterium]|nr:type II secretion system protein [Candidatus Saccharibacteria bacterium]
MFVKKSAKNQGFTIIEVLIVLAIAGLIMLIVFLAVPALQRNSRNTQAKNEAASMLGALNEFMNNNNGKLPAVGVSTTGGTNDASKVFASAKFTNVTALTIEAQAGTTAPTSTTDVLRLGAKCTSATGSTVTPLGAARQVALLYMIEDSAGTLVACQES